MFLKKSERQWNFPKTKSFSIFFVWASNVIPMLGPNVIIIMYKLLIVIVCEQSWVFFWKHLY